MDHVPGLQIPARGDAGLARGAAAELAALLQDFRSSRPVDGAVHPAPAQEGSIGGIDNGPRILPGDVPFYYFQHRSAYQDFHTQTSGCYRVFRFSLFAFRFSLFVFRFPDREIGSDPLPMFISHQAAKAQAN
jgi:hypothetical protein